jgi:signal transduction histidine kinase
MGTLLGHRAVRRCVTSTVVTCTLLLSDDVAWSQPRQKNVLVLYSTRRDAQIVVVGDRDIPRILEHGLPEGLDYYSEHLEQSRLSDRFSEQAFHDFLRLKYGARRFDLVIAMGEIALGFAEGNRSALFPETPVVFFSSDRATRPIANSTGVIAPLNLSGSIALALELQPDTRHVFVVTGAGRDASYASAAQVQLRQFENRMLFTYLSGLTTPQLESRLATLPDGSIVYYLVVNRAGADEVVHPLRYLDRVAAAARVPTYSWVDSAIGHGIVGGSLKSQEAEVSAVAHLALRVLRGERADGIPPSEVDLNITQVDWRQALRWHIDEARIPAGTRIVFREPGLWDRYKLYVLLVMAIVLGESLLITGLLMQRKQRRRAEQRMRDTLSELRASDERNLDLNRRLLNAQDAERSTIARELHDDIGPQVAILAIDLALLARAEHRREDVTTLARKAFDRTQEIAEALQNLSHRVHPGTAHLIGLVAALESLQRDFSRSGLSVAFAHSDIPVSLRQELALCVFRVVQEALRNAVKHSAARDVSIQLSASADTMVLTVADDGMGFDLEAARRRGLGLSSMTEQLEQLGGTLTIDTKIGAGTRLEAIVPLRPA